MPNLTEIKSRLSGRPLVICDVDEVVLEFLTPFRNFLISQDLNLLSDSFSLHGNVVHAHTGKTVEDGMVSELINALFANQKDWQTPVNEAHGALHALSEDTDIVFLTAMPEKHYSVRRELLNSFDMPFSLLATESEKGPLISELSRQTDKSSFFIDDMVFNHKSALEHSPETHNIYIMANDEFRAIAPELPPSVYDANNWTDIHKFIKAKI